MERLKPYFPILTPLFFLLLTLVVTYPLVLYLPTYVADLGDPLLNTWALAWGRHAFLQPWSAVGDLFNANGFFPYQYSLGFSEHLLLYAALTLPLSAFDLGPVFAHNGAILFSMALAGWGMALLVTHWTKNRWTGLVAGVIFAFIPARLNHWAHLHQLSVQWLPFLVLYLDRWLAGRKWRDMVLFGLFFNFQLLSTINYMPQTIMLVGLFLLYGLLRYPRHLLSGRVIGGGLAVVFVTALINWPIVKIYFELKELHGFERSLGDASIYGAALIDYITPPPENLLYGDWLTPRIAQATRPLIPLFIGLVPTLLALIGASVLILNGAISAGLKKTVFFLLALLILAVVLSFGANESALGERWSEFTRQVLIYRWLYEYVPGFSGLRVPARIAILVFFAVAALGGIGLARLTRFPRLPAATPPLILFLIVLEYLPVPLPGTQVLVGQAVPPVNQYLASEPADRVTLVELPYELTQGGANELLRLYYSSGGWYRLVNGASGFNPAGSVDLSRQLQNFPDASSFELLRRLGVTRLVLHSAEYPPEQWQDIRSKLPTYWSSIDSLAQFGDDYLLTLRRPTCSPQPELVLIQPTQTNGQLGLSLENKGPAALVNRFQAVNQIQAGSRSRRFVEPLFIPAGERRELADLLSLPADFDGQIRLDLPYLSFEGDLVVNESVPADSAGPDQISPPQTPLDVYFGDAFHLLGYTLIGRAGTNCRVAELRLFWETGTELDSEMQATVRLVDRFGQTVVSAASRPQEWRRVSLGGMEVLVADYRVPVIETVPAGQFGLLLGVAADGSAPYQPANTGQLMVVGPELLLSDLLVRPLPPAVKWTGTEPPGAFENGIKLLGYELDKTTLNPGDWLRLTLYWRADRVGADDLTVFTQLIDAGGQVRGQQDNPPRSGWYPTTLWQPGEIVSDDYLIYLFPATPPGELSLHVGLYDPETLTRVAVVDDTGGGLGDTLLVATLTATQFPP